MLSSILCLSTIVNMVLALNYSTSGPLNVSTAGIPLVTRQIWCNSQSTICASLCSNDVSSNLCNPNVLSYSCVCANGPTPNISSYKETLPFYICEEWIANCVDNHPNNLKAITACRSVTCGDKNASTDSTSSPASSSSAGSGSKPTNTASSTSSHNLAAATNFAASYGTHLIAGGMLAAFGLAL